jgi:hypothetical protein
MIRTYAGNHVGDDKGQVGNCVVVGTVYESDETCSIDSWTSVCIEQRVRPNALRTASLREGKTHGQWQYHRRHQLVA